jgi:hypothetical protein
MATCAAEERRRARPDETTQALVDTPLALIEVQGSQE